MTLIGMYMREEDAECRTSVVWPDEKMDWFADLEDVESECEIAIRVENEFIRVGTGEECVCVRSDEQPVWKSRCRRSP